MRYIIIKYFSPLISRSSINTRKKLSRLISFLIVRFFSCYLKSNVYVNYNHIWNYMDKNRKRRYFTWKLYAKDLLYHYIYEQLEITRVFSMSKNEIKNVAISMGIYKHKYLVENGGIIVIPHQSGWEIAGIAIGYVFGDRSLTVAESKGIDKRTYELYEKIRGLTGMRVLPVETSGKEMLRHLKKGGVLILVGDRDILKTGWEVKVFGDNAKLPNGAISLSSMTRKPIIFASLKRDNNNLISAYIVGIINRIYNKKDIKTNGIEDYKYFLEKAILYNPEEWFVFYPIWV